MGRLWINGLGLTAAMLTTTGYPASAQAAAADAAPSEVAAPVPSAMAQARPKSSFVPDAFDAPTLVEAPGFKLVPLGPDVVKVDFDAYMSSIEHLQKTFTRGTQWPREGISDADAMRDMENEQARFTNRRSFAYAVLTPDGSRERGSVYVQPSSVAGYDAVVKMWVTKADYDAGFDAELYKWVTAWIQTDWPFKNVAYPGRAIEWSAWDALAANDPVAAAGPKHSNQ
jgi:hypothetical protein